MDQISFFCRCISSYASTILNRFSVFSLQVFVPLSEIRYPLVHFSFLCQYHLDFGIIAHWHTLGQVLGYLQLYSLVLLISLVIHDLCSSI